MIGAGAPIYSHRRALVCRRFFPPEQISDAILRHVDDSGGEAFFTRPEWEKELRELHHRLWERFGSHAITESQDEYHQRMYTEIKESKTIIEKELDKQVNFICWPGGAYNKACIEVANEAGYLSWTLASKDATAFRNTPGADPSRIKRVSSYDRSRSKGRTQVSPFEYYCFLERHKGSIIHRWLGWGAQMKSKIQRSMNGGKR